ncbi:hypothetical protein BLNAU_17155 [Blattamonas nauphoetae]|uniref:Uncharacterized protein n=1 Tax=Blattamonas nauphoetae TaxID=2049346 RepID=A0ABQ9X9K2_9EUKA|nr:hypothetical protein BLNAU_17155 [Blattamonas nauphoetae]
MCASNGRDDVMMGLILSGGGNMNGGSDVECCALMERGWANSKGQALSVYRKDEGGSEPDDVKGWRWAEESWRTRCLSSHPQLSFDRRVKMMMEGAAAQRVLRRHTVNEARLLGW